MATAEKIMITMSKHTEVLSMVLATKGGGRILDFAARMI